jgi:SAM-dependent methyltransferase
MFPAGGIPVRAPPRAGPPAAARQTSRAAGANRFTIAWTGVLPTQFTCNVCGRRGRPPEKRQNAEDSTCSRCGSNVRTRALLRALSQELFGANLTLAAFPRIKSLRGIGIGDSDLYAGRLEEKFGYHNTFFHREPRLDIAHPPESEFGQYDFAVSSEVFEHVAPPAEAAFQNVCRLLRPNGVFVFTVPYSLDESTVEHFPELHEYAIARLGEGHVLINRTREGKLEVHENLVFHGGPGSTLEMRVFSEGDLKRMLAGAGFREVRIYGEDCPEFGIVRNGPWSLPLAARKGEFAFRVDAAGELIAQWDALMRSRWLRLGAKLRLLRRR